MKVKVGISNRHIHLTEEAYRLLFDVNLTKKADLNQPGEFASNETVTIKTQKGEIENVRIVGPFRKYNQVEISYSDAIKLGINPPVRRSGNLKDACDLVVSSNKGSFLLKSCCIVANRHVHMSESMARSLRLKDDDEVKIKVDSLKGGVLTSFVKVSKDGFFELHLDRDDAASLQLKNGDEVELIYEF